MAAALGTSSKCGFGSSSTVDKFLEVLSESVRLTRPILYNGGMVGSRSQPAERTREGQRQVAGSISCTPSPVELDGLLEYIVGGSESADVFPLAETVSAFYFTADRHAKVFTYSGCKVNRATFSASRGGFLQLDLDILGIDETVGNSGTFPAISLDVASQPYVMTDGALTVGGTTYTFDQFSITIDNQLEVQHFNSLTPTRISATGREVSWNVVTPYGDATAAYGTAVGGVAFVATFTNGNRSISFSSNKVQVQKESPVPGGRGEIFLSLAGVARKDGSTAELVITSDSSG